MPNGEEGAGCILGVEGLIKNISLKYLDKIKPEESKPLNNIDTQCKRTDLIQNEVSNPSVVADIDSKVNNEETWEIVAPDENGTDNVIASSKSERVFSVAGRIVSPDRNRLAPELVENLVIMKCNLRLLKEINYLIQNNEINKKRKCGMTKNLWM